MRDGLTRVPILYDRDCGFCRFSLAFVLAWDRRRRLEAVAIQSARGALLLDELSPEQRLASWHLVLPAGRVSGGAALAPLLRMLPGGALLSTLPAHAPTLAERAYGLLARHRGRLGRILPAATIARADVRIARASGEPAEQPRQRPGL